MSWQGYKCKHCGETFDFMTDFSKHRVWKRIGRKVFAKCQEEEYKQIKFQASA